MRNVTVAIAVILLHAVAIRALLDARETILSLVTPRTEPVTHWILLPPLRPVTVPLPRPPVPSTGLPMASLFGGGENARAPATGGVSLAPLIALPSPINLPALANAPMSFLGDYFACNFEDYDKATEEERRRCGLILSNMGDVTPLVSGYSDYEGTSFSLFGAKGTVLISAATRPAFSLMDDNAGCEWMGFLCQPALPHNFALDLQDDRRGTIAAKFELASGLSLYIGAQDYMANYLGGARPVLSTGAAFVYRW